MPTPEKKILLARSQTMRSHFGTKGSHIAAAWPGSSQRPRFELIELSELLAATLSKELLAKLEKVTLLVALGPDVATRQAIRMIDNLREVLAAGVIVYSPEHSALTAHQGDGLIIEPLDPNDARIA